ncbi:MAG TPA: hypothetical protein VH247_10205 [Thermoleophilaceae bacterium]|nr:hypothetical protein [Thermoleophilaceae bacterium]
MRLLVPATALLLLFAGCGGSDRRHAQETPHSAPRTVTATTAPPATATSEAEVPATTEAQQQPPAVPAPPADGAWKDCGRIRSPVDRRQQHVQARVFDCRAARRVAVRYLRNGSLPQGWGPADCAASRAACEQGGWGFRVVQK